MNLLMNVDYHAAFNRWEYFVFTFKNTCLPKNNPLSFLRGKI